ncbi:hypothetical protein RTCIAT899_PA00270 (plasmid) [Rhizobium tropici CIAT 899]|uniref:Uncharacterized protein n=1 Tax=Rhizobium tropici TaxID=398 RepID=A0ABR6R3W8_RHITR|nr:hypothetical protein RTCIAT899_PA00270 [Rhizobium tropici CIAT 899]MBB6493882.1 hypothetical protein [Rhizobium tropici]
MYLTESGSRLLQRRVRIFFGLLAQFTINWALVLEPTT